MREPLTEDMKRKVAEVLAIRPSNGAVVWHTEKWERAGKPFLPFHDYAVAMLATIYPKRYVRGMVRDHGDQMCILDTMEYHIEVSPWTPDLTRKEMKKLPSRMRSLAMARFFHRDERGRLKLSMERVFTMTGNVTFPVRPDEMEMYEELARVGYSMAEAKRQLTRRGLK